MRTWIDQLIGQGLLARSDGEYPTVTLTAHGARVLRGEEAAGPLSRAPRPTRSRAAASDHARGDDGAGEAYDRGLFETLRSLRRGLAQERGVPPYIVFSDVALRDMARRRPTTPAAFLMVKGVGEWKAEEFGPKFLGAIREFLG